MGVTAALIVRDEEDFIAGCLESLTGRVDEIVLVDTGSRDSTIEIARRFPIRLYRFPWRGDFSAARNCALDQASGEWILYIDADERLLLPSPDALSQVLSDKSKVAWRLRLYPRVGWTAYSELRLFRNDPRIRFEGVIHESMWPGLDAVARAERLEVGDSDIGLCHVGYEADQRPKNPRNIPLLQERLSRDPDNFFCWWHLGDCLRLAGDEDAAAASWMEGIARLRAVDPQPRHLGHSLLYLALLNLRQKRGEPISDLLDEALACFPGNLALQFMSARAAIDKGDLDTAHPILERLAAIDSETLFEPQLAYDKALFGHLSSELLALCYFRNGRFSDAARLYRLAAQTSKAPAACELKARLAELRAAG
jgi:glycosyltransferase involved in cell wall biosynthesis